MPKNRHADELALADHLLDTAQLGRELSHAAMLQALAQAKAGELRDPAKTAQNAIIAAGVALDKRLVIQERPTTIIEHRDPLTDGKQLLRELGILGTAVDIGSNQTLQPPQAAIPAESPSTTTPSTSPARESARKTRVRTRDTAAGKHAD